MNKNNLYINTDALIAESYINSNAFHDITNIRHVKFDDDGKKYICYVSSDIIDPKEIEKEIQKQIKQEKLIEKFFKHFNFEFNNQN